MERNVLKKEHLEKKMNEAGIIGYSAMGTFTIEEQLDQVEFIQEQLKKRQLGKENDENIGKG